jgi:hypothetical protein
MVTCAHPNPKPAFGALDCFASAAKIYHCRNFFGVFFQLGNIKNLSAHSSCRSGFSQKSSSSCCAMGIFDRKIRGMLCHRLCLKVDQLTEVRSLENEARSVSRIEDKCFEN